MAFFSSPQWQPAGVGIARSCATYFGNSPALGETVYTASPFNWFPQVMPTVLPTFLASSILPFPAFFPSFVAFTGLPMPEISFNVTSDVECIGCERCGQDIVDRPNESSASSGAPGAQQQYRGRHGISDDKLVRMTFYRCSDSSSRTSLESSTGVGPPISAVPSATGTLPLVDMVHDLSTACQGVHSGAELKGADYKGLDTVGSLKIAVKNIACGRAAQDVANTAEARSPMQVPLQRSCLLDPIPDRKRLPLRNPPAFPNDLRSPGFPREVIAGGWTEEGSAKIHYDNDNTFIASRPYNATQLFGDSGQGETVADRYMPVSRAGGRVLMRGSTGLLTWVDVRRYHAVVRRRRQRAAVDGRPGVASPPCKRTSASRLHLTLLCSKAFRKPPEPLGVSSAEIHSCTSTVESKCDTDAGAVDPHANVRPDEAVASHSDSQPSGVSPDGSSVQDVVEAVPLQHVVTPAAATSEALAPGTIERTNSARAALEAELQAVLAEETGMLNPSDIFSCSHDGMECESVHGSTHREFADSRLIVAFPQKL